MRMTTFGTSFAALLLILAIVVVALLGAEVNRANASAGADSPANAYKLSKPFTHNNLTIYLIHGADTIKNRNILTLQEAMAAKKVRVIETKDVNELAIENLSQTDDVFVQSGDIVKGGQQDRVLAVDLILPPRSGRIPIAAFCVESGRWSKRGNEDAAQFNASDDRIATRDLKVAANSTRSQADVWKKVGEAQERLSQNVGSAVNVSGSESSLQLSLENKQVRRATEAYIKAFLKIVDGQSDVIGYAFAINGKMNSADVYASNALFKKLWPKLLRATAVEALADFQRDLKFDAVDEAQVRAFLAGAEKGKDSVNNVNARTRMITRESDQAMFMETRDVKAEESWLHRSYIKK